MQLILKKKNVNTIDRTFDISEGSTYTENYNETLDSAVIRLSHITSHIDIEPFDKVVLHDENGNLPDKYMCVDSYTETMECLDPYIYSYEISLFSETKELENVLLPNLSITQNKEEPRIVLYYINRYLALYSPKIRRNNNRVNKYRVSSRVINKFNKDCPEMQWNCPTLREVLNDLMMVQDCIVVLRNNVIDYIDLTEKKNAIDTSKVNYIQNSQSSEDYVSELKMDMLNVMQTSLDGVKQTVNRTEFQTFRAPDNGSLVNDENMILKTEYPILNIKHLYMIFQYTVSTSAQKLSENSGTVMYKVDLCDVLSSVYGHRKLVYEYTEYQTLPLHRTTLYTFEKIYQNICVYFVRESNIITGFNVTSKRAWLPSSSESTLYMLKDIIAKECYSANGKLWGYPTTPNGSPYFSTFFIIEYETTADAVFKAGKDIAPTHERVVTDNQTNAYVDAYNQGFMEYQKVNRLGNKQLYINARYQDDFEDIIKIGDYYEDNIIYQTTYQIYKNHIEVNAVATKNYILRDYFTGVKARIRSWKIADATQSFTRHDLEKYYLEFSKSEKLEYTTYNENIPQYFLSPLVPGYIKPLKYCFIKTSGEYYIPNNYYSIELLGRIVGNSVIFTCGLNDNFSAGKRVLSDLNVLGNNCATSNFTSSAEDVFRLINILPQYGGIPLEELRYVDKNGEITDIEYIFTNEINDIDLPEDIIGFGAGGQSQKEWMNKVCMLPVIDVQRFEDNIVYSNTKTIYKDNREMPKISTQFELCSDSHDIIFTRKFLELQECIRELTTSESQVRQETLSYTCLVSDFQQRGGPVTTDVTVEPPYQGIILGDDTRVYSGNYEFLIPSLYGKTMDSLSIENTISEINNTVNFDGNYSYVHPVTGQTEYAGRFYGTIYTYNENQPQSANITYATTDSPTAYWFYGKSVNLGLKGQRVTNIQVSGWTATGSDLLEVTFNQSTGYLYIHIKTFTQPVSDINLTITYDLVLQDGAYVANIVKVYQDDKDNFNWRNPELGDATVVTGASLSFVHSNKSSKITINGVNNHTEHVYYITDNSDNILLAIKGANTFYLNCLLSRDYNIYDNSGNVVGSI